MKTLAYLFYGIPIPIITAYVTVWAYDWFGLAWWLAYLIGINVAAYLIYALDKSIVKMFGGDDEDDEKKDGPRKKVLRAPENILAWGFILGGGGVGALYGMILSNHKVSKKEFHRKLLLAFSIFFGLSFLIVRQGWWSSDLANGVIESACHTIIEITNATVTIILETLRST